MNDLLTYDVARGVAHLELNRPGAANALDLPLAQALRAGIARADADNDVRAVLVTGAGKRFCAGGDVGAILEAPKPEVYIEELALEADAATRALTDLAKPVVAGVQGAVAGAGLALMLSADLIVASPETKFVFAYPSVGLTPDCGLSYLLPRAVGQQRALKFALMSEPANVDDALAWGLITEPAADATGRAREIAIELAGGSALALGESRRLLRGGWENDRASTGAEEARTIGRLMTGAEANDLTRKFISR